MIRKLLIKLLFKLLEENKGYDGINDGLIDEWLKMQLGSRGFREYFKKRDLQLLKTFPVATTHESHLILIGQRLELMKLIDNVGKSKGKGKNKDNKNKKKT